MKRRSYLINPGLSLLLLLIVLASAMGARAETIETEKTSEVVQTVAAESGVIVNLCLLNGSISVRGWDQNQLRVHSKDAESIELRRGVQSATGPATRIEVLVSNGDAGGPHELQESCNATADVVLDVPRGAVVRLQTRDGDVSVKDVTEARVEAQTGDIDLVNISKLVEAKSLNGDISLKDSSGRVVLVSVSGSVEAENVRPNETGDDFEAVSVSGDLALDRVGHTQVRARTISGSLNLEGSLAHGGRYDFKTVSGDMTLSLPSESSFKVNAKITQGGDIISDFAVRPTVEVANPPTPPPTPRPVNSPPTSRVTVRPAPRPAPYPSHMPEPERLTGIVGMGDATLNLASFSGTIHLRRR